jgi:hypothetical protein
MKKSVSTSLLFVAYCIAASAEMTGDRQLLVEVATRYSENLAKLKTWKGKAEARKHSVANDPQEPRDWLSEWKVDFACAPGDARDGSYRYDMDLYKHVAIVEGVEQPRLRPTRSIGIYHNGVVSQLDYVTDNPRAARIARISKGRLWEGGFHYGSFDPLWFYTYSGTWLDEYLMRRVEVFDKEHANGSVSREGDHITLINEFGGVSIVQVMDLARGGNRVHYLCSETDQGFRLTTSIETTWTEINGCWTPDTVTYSNSTDREGSVETSSMKIHWTEQQVNREFKADEFSIDRLGLRPGDNVDNGITGKMEIVGDDK